MWVADNYSTVWKIIALMEGQFLNKITNLNMETDTIATADSLADYVYRLLAGGFYADDLAYGNCDNTVFQLGSTRKVYLYRWRGKALILRCILAQGYIRDLCVRTYRISFCTSFDLSFYMDTKGRKKHKRYKGRFSIFIVDGSGKSFIVTPSGLICGNGTHSSGFVRHNGGKWDNHGKINWRLMSRNSKQSLS